MPKPENKILFGILLFDQTPESNFYILLLIFMRFAQKNEPRAANTHKFAIK